MNSRRKQRLLAVSGLVTTIALSIALMLFALNDNIDFFYTPSQVVNGKSGVKPVVGHRLRVGGLVVEGSVKRSPQSLAVEFLLVDTGPTVRVIFQGILPDLFREGQGIIATGLLQENGVIIADEVLAKHDEEYMPPELAEQLKGIKHVKPSNPQTGY